MERETTHFEKGYKIITRASATAKICVEMNTSECALIALCAYLFDTFEHELLVSSLVGLVDTFSHFSIADNSQ